MQAIYRQRAGESSVDASNWAQDLFFAAGLAFVYFILARASLFFVIQPEGVSAVWPPTGFALAALLLTRQRRRSLILLGIFVANLVANLITPNSLPVSLGFAVAKSAEAVLATWLLHRFFHPPVTFDHLIQVIGLFAVAIPSAAVTAFLGAAISTLAFGADYSHVWFTWWIADALGMLLITPLMVMWAVRPTLVKLLDPFAMIEAVLLFGALTVFSWLLFFSPASVFDRLPLSAYMTLPFLIWASLRFSPRTVMVGLTYLSILGIAGTTLGYGYFAQFYAEPFYPVLMAQLFLAVLVICALVLSVALSESRRAHRLLRVDEKELRMVLQTTRDGFWIMDSAGHLLDVNDAYCTNTGYDRAELLKMVVAELEAERTSADLVQQIQRVIEKGTDRFETRYQRKDGTLFDVEISVTWVPERGIIFGFLRDISESKRANQALHESEERYRSLADFFPEGVLMHRDGKIIFANSAAASILGPGTPDDLYGRRLLDFVHPEFQDAVIQRVQKILANEQTVPRLEEKLVRLDGKIIDADVLARPILFDGKITSLTVFRDITERKQAEQALRENERYLARAQQIAHLGHWSFDIKSNTVHGSDEFFRILGLEAGDSSFESFVNLVQPDQRDFFTSTVRRAIDEHTAFDIEIGLLYSDGARKYLRVVGESIVDEKDRLGRMIGTVQDITERSRRERELEAVVSVSEALRSAITRTQIFPIIVAQVSALLNTIGAAIGQFDPITGESVIEYGNGSWATGIGLRTPQGMGVSGYVARTLSTYVTQDLASDPFFYSRQLIGEIHGAACVPLITQDRVMGWLFAGVPKGIGEEDVRILKAIANIAANAIDRTTLYERMEQNLQRLVALRTIDQAVSSSFDLRVTLDILLSCTLTELQVDSAVILLHKPIVRTLEFIAGRGLRTNSFRKSEVRLGESFAGRAALERRTIIVKDWHNEIFDSKFKAFTSNLQAEGFVSFIAVPLIAKGLVQGVLEVYHRSPLTPDNDWLNFLHSLAGQAAIAIDNATLFDNLQHSNSELTQSYDATIEGWSRALDLRDKETEGHTKRVTDLTMLLARAMGVPDADLVHIRRGALLHDIGKMGVADAILRKPFALDEDEWRQMRMHPEYARQLIAPIPYLRPALDIPYSHHEKWDGTGYPRSLKGEEIPLVARIFAVIDVWDALTSDRPYRRAWSAADARAYLCEQVGKHFDPKVVDAFLRILGDV